MKLIITKGATGVSVNVFIRDNSVSTGVGLTGLAFNTASLTAYYVRQNGTATAITLATQTATGAYSSGGFVAVDGTNMPGLYRLDIPDAVLASGVNTAYVMLKGATNMEPCVIEIQLAALDVQTATQPVNVTQYGGVAGTFAGGRPEVNTTHFGGTVAATPTTAGIPTVRLAAAGVADILSTALTEAYRADGSTGTLTQLLYEIIAHLGESSISGTTKTTKRIDGTTTAATYTLDSATTPTSITRAT